ncbi:MAG: hypothetical protein GY811_18955, partial [Myxococcales bacterium]|nr:hypothetical protein [Myxococcales bacterium]
LEDGQFESIVRLIESQMDLSMARLLATQAEDERVQDPSDDDGESS